MPWLTGDDIPEDTFCRVIRVPNDPTFIHAVSGALLDLTYARNWEQLGTLTAQQQADAFDQIYIDFTQEMCVEPMVQIYPQFFFCDAGSFYAATGGQPKFTISTVSQQNVVAETNTAAVGDRLKTTCFCAAGTYSMRISCIMNTNEPIVNIILDGVDTGVSFDLYNAALLNNAAITVTVVIPTDGNHKLEFYCPTKRAAATNYRMPIASIRGHMPSVFT